MIKAVDTNEKNAECVDKPEVNLSYTENKTYAAAEIKGATAAVALVVKDKVEENGPTKVMDHTDRSAPANGIEATILKKDSTPVTKSANSAVTNIAGQPPPLKKWAFQMSVHEDFLNLDDDGYTNGIASNLLAEETENLDTSLMASKFSFCETMKVERPLVSSEGKPPTNSINQNADVVIFKGTAFSEKSAVFAFPVAPATSMTIQPAVSSLGTNPEMIQVQPKETSNAPSIFNFSSKSVDKVSPVKYSSTSIVGSLDFNAGGSFSLSTGGGNKSNWKMVKVRRNPRKK